MKNTIVKNDASAKKNLHVLCCHCSSSLTVRNGTYPRNDPKNNTEIRVQRYLCKSPECPWKSFSVLPELVLPVIRSWNRSGRHPHSGVDQVVHVGPAALKCLPDLFNIQYPVLFSIPPPAYYRLPNHDGRVRGPGRPVAAICPGFVASDFFANGSGSRFTPRPGHSKSAGTAVMQSTSRKWFSCRTGSQVFTPLSFTCFTSAVFW